MNILNFALMAAFLIFSTSANSALVSRLGGLAYYDTEANLTWLADANYAQTSGYDSDGRMTWQQSMDWAAALNVGGIDGWRLADTLQPDAGCSQNISGTSFGFFCTGSEMGNLFYNVLGGSAASPITRSHNSNYDLFSNVQSSYYWSATEYAPDTEGSAWLFDIFDGTLLSNLKTDDWNHYAWAVYSGDVSAVPIPAAFWLFGSGLIGLVGLARCK